MQKDVSMILQWIVLQNSSRTLHDIYTIDKQLLDNGAVGYIEAIMVS